MVIVEEEEYKGNPILVLKAYEDDQRHFRFGWFKSKLILEAIDEIREFYNKYDRNQNEKM